MQVRKRVQPPLGCDNGKDWDVTRARNLTNDGTCLATMQHSYRNKYVTLVKTLAKEVDQNLDLDESRLRLT